MPSTTSVTGGAGNIVVQPLDTSIRPPQVPGFDPAGQPLGDANVWEGVTVGRRQVNTALAERGGKKTLDLGEQKALGRLAMERPQEFMQRLLADSMNGTPVSVAFTREIKGFGVGHAEFRVENGKLEIAAHVDVYNKVADKWLKPYLAQNPRTKGERSRLSIELGGQIQKDGGVDGITAEASAKNLPAFSPEKLMELKRVAEELKTIMKSKRPAAEKQAEVLATVDRSLRKASEYGVGLILEIITGSANITADISEAKHSTKVRLTTGEGKFGLVASDLLGSDSKDEANLGAELRGSVDEGKSRISIDALRVYEEDKLSVGFNEEGKPQLLRADPTTGEKKPVNDHLAEALMFLPMILGGRNPID